MSENEVVDVSNESELPEELKTAIEQQCVAAETLVKRLQAVHENGMISDESMSAISGWSERLARTTAQLKEHV